MYSVVGKFRKEVEIKERSVKLSVYFNLVKFKVVNRTRTDFFICSFIANTKNNKNLYVLYAHNTVLQFFAVSVTLMKSTA